MTLVSINASLGRNAPPPMMSTNSPRTDPCERSAWEITWSCVAVIIACTWKAVHPNVLPAHLRGSSKWRLILRRLRMTLWALLVPELMVMWAVTQWFDAREISELHKRRSGQDVESSEGDSYVFVSGSGDSAREATVSKPRPNAPGEILWTTVHSLFLTMGGFVVNIGGVEHTLRLDDIVPQPPGSKEYPRIPWPAVEGGDINDKSKIDGIAKTLVTVQTTWFIVQLLIRAIERLAVTELEVMTLAYALMCAFLYGFWWNKPYDVHKPILTGTMDQLEVAEPPRRSMSPTSLLDGDWIMYLHGTIVEDTRLDYLSEVAPDRNGRIAIVISLISATLFGSIHCIAWNFQFPTPIERIIWISSSLVIVAVPPLWVCEAVTVIACKATEIRPSIRNALVAPRYVILAVSVYAYFLARVLLIVQAFVLLRELPPSAEQPVRWTYFLPHI